MATRQQENHRELQIGWDEQQELEWEQCDGCWFCAPETAEDFRLHNEWRTKTNNFPLIKPPLFIVPPPEPDEPPLLVPLGFWLERLPVCL